MSAKINAFVDTTNIFDVVQKKDRKKISQKVTVPHLKGICNVIISLTSVPKCLADSVGTMKIAHRKFIQDSPKGEKGPLQAMLLPVAVATAAAQDAAASTSPCCLYLIDAIAVALPEDDEITEDVGTGSGGSCKRPRATVSPSGAPAATASTDSTDSTTVPAPALSSGTATSAGAFSTGSPSSSLASGRVGRGAPLKNELQVGANIGAFTIVGYSPTLGCIAVTTRGNPCSRRQVTVCTPGAPPFTLGTCAHLACMKQTPSQREAYLAKKRATLDELAIELRSMSLVFQTL